MRRRISIKLFKNIICRGVFLVWFQDFVSASEAFARNLKPTSVAVETVNVIEVQAERKYLGASLAQKLCDRIAKEQTLLLASCDLQPDAQKAGWTLSHSLRPEAGHFLFETLIFSESSVKLATIHTNSGGEEYDRISLESHVEKVMKRLKSMTSLHQSEHSDRFVEGGVLVSDGNKIHDGFYCSSLVGFARMVMGGGEISGFPLALGLKAGAAVSRHIILFGAFDYGWLQSPKIKGILLDCIGKTCQSQKVSEVRNGQIHYLTGSFGVTYYTDANYFLQASMGLASLIKSSYEVSEGTYSPRLPDLSTVFQVAIGKEWWVSKEWGIGLALFGVLSPGITTGKGIAYFVGGIGVTATYN